MANVEAERQSGCDRLFQALCSLTEASTMVLSSAVGLEHRLVGTSRNGFSEQPECAEVPYRALLKEIEWRVREALCRVREAHESLVKIESEVG